MRFLLMGLFLMGLSCQVSKEKQKPKIDAPSIILVTSQGTIRIALFPDLAPISVKNFLVYAHEGFYSGTIFHRVIDGFVVQGGGFTPDLAAKPTHPPVQCEAGNGLRNKRGTLAMARTSDVHSATSQFYINLSDNGFLDFKAPTASGYGYAVFGEVIEGMEVVDKIGKMATETKNHFPNVPVEPVIIEEVIQEYTHSASKIGFGQRENSRD